MNGGEHKENIWSLSKNFNKLAGMQGIEIKMTLGDLMLF